MLAQFKLMILSIFMAGNLQAVDINMDNIENLKEVACLSQAVQGEAGNQSFEGKLAVAHVIINRTKDEGFPETICGVVKQPGQFDFKPRKINEENPSWRDQMEQSIVAAIKAVNGEAEDPTRGSLYFANPKIATDRTWLHRMRSMFTIRIGDHVFFGKKNPSPRFRQ